MKTIIKHSIIYFILFILLSVGTLSVFTRCVNDTDEDESPKIVGCNSVEFRGWTFTHLGCTPGINSFTTYGTENGHEFNFRIYCRDGCISRVIWLGDL